ncbi:AMP-dependent synthetase [Acrocarpospora corrugata]|uniref:AMP-dependent synthetase n=1 Tax=Acrocarpospora corrugata TaxID=35763 RepID=A0A5M3WCC8_9ACTN|nr:AMP-binding protein [Acrocarpospora corrugata]GES05712.1 AMP-dependent synthetase [Acrocarpospora corrugata]
MNIAEWLAAIARRRPHAPALLDGDRVVSDYAGFADAASSVAGYLAEQGVVPGDRVGVYLANTPRYLELLYGIWWAGAIAVPINRKLAPAEVATIVADSGASVVFTGDVAVPDTRGPAAPVEREPGDLAWLFYTSGTTGRPKGVMLTHANLIAMSLCHLADVDPIGPGEAVLYAAPISHGAGLYGLIHVRMGSRHIFPPSGRFDPDNVLVLARKVGAVSLFAAPTMVRRLVDAARSKGADGIKTVIYGGGPMYLADIQDAIAVLGERFVQIYGQGESPMTITALSREDHRDPGRLASVGTAQSVVRVRVCDADGRPLPPGSTGEIEVKGATVMAGYWNDPVATADAVRDGWLRTGDLGRFDEDGYLTLAGRSKELIVSGGSNIYPREVEDVLVGHPAVAEAAVVGVPDPEWGETVVAFVVPAPGAEFSEGSLDELDEHCRDRIARFKRPRRYHVVPDLPKNAYGKVLKTELLEKP